MAHAGTTLQCQQPTEARQLLMWLGLRAVPLLGSLITEPAAVTIAALLLAPHIFRPAMPEGVKYLTLGVLCGLQQW
jgi:hypothetical protein